MLACHGVDAQARFVDVPSIAGRGTRQAPGDGTAKVEEKAVADAAAPGEGPSFWRAHASQGFDGEPSGVNAMIFLVAAQG